MRALLIDDSSTMRAILRRILHDLGVAEISEAASGEDALRLVADHPNAYFDVILIDRNMPGENGAQVTRRLRALPTGAQPKILMVSSDASFERVKDALSAGCDGFLAKPFTVEQLKQRFARLHLTV